MPECPRCGSPHDTDGGVVQHMFMSKNEAHSDITDKGEAWMIIKSGDGSDGDDNSGDNTPQTRSSQHPLKDGPESNQSQQSGSKDECPECGTVGDTSDFSDGDVIVCDGCGTELVYHE